MRRYEDRILVKSSRLVGWKEGDVGGHGIVIVDRSDAVSVPVLTERELGADVVTLRE